jgi:hypothetical protein
MLELVRVKGGRE